MLVNARMTKDPVTIGPESFLSEARELMTKGGFRRLPVVQDGSLVGIVTDRDLRAHEGFLDKTKVNAAMTEDPVTVTPGITLENAALILLRHKFDSLPVVDHGKVTGIVTTTDILRAFLDVMGATKDGTVRIDLILKGKGHDIPKALDLIQKHGGTMFSAGTYSESWGKNRVFFLRIRAENPQAISKALEADGFEVLGVRE